MDFNGVQFNSVACPNLWATKLRFSFSMNAESGSITNLANLSIFGTRCADTTTSHNEQSWSENGQEFTFDLNVDSMYYVTKPRFVITPATSNCMPDTWTLTAAEPDIHDIRGSTYACDDSAFDLILSCADCLSSLATRKQLHTDYSAFAQYYFSGSVTYGAITYSATDAPNDYQFKLRFIDKCRDATVNA